MNTQEIINGNKLIAEFMEQIYIDKQNEKFYLFSDGTSSSESELKYHSSWDWLMPVINKIHDLDIYPKYKDETSGQFNEGGIIINFKFIDITFKGCVEFIQWYNQNKK